ncbi:MAG: helix-turn-helix domain-containing protein [Lachnospiraceae bacterium]|nr:helix-turn-helix domain-containing protein [Lachnospiraceae bacterium]
MTEQYIRERISSLRIQRKVSEYRMSLELGHSKGYIQSITSGRSMPSMSEFLSICKYLDVTPRDFFDEGIEYPMMMEKLYDEVREMNPENLEFLVELGKRLH